MSTATKNYLVDYNQNPEMYKINFGKYKRKMLKEIDDMPYLEWCLKTHKIVEPIKQHIQNYFDAINYVPEKKINGDEYVLTFGKHKGKTFNEIDKEYLQWMLNSDKIYEGIKTRIRMFLESH